MSDEMNHPRQVAHTEVKGWFMLPMGVHIFQRPPDQHPEKVVVSTVCLDGGHLEDPLHWLEPEHGFETMVFLDGSSMLPVYVEHYETRAQAVRGHKSVLKRLRDKTLPLAFKLAHYYCNEDVETKAAVLKSNEPKSVADNRQNARIGSRSGIARSR